MTGIVIFFAILWLIAPITVALLGGSVLWVVLAFVIGGLIVLGLVSL